MGLRERMDESFFIFEELEEWYQVFHSSSKLIKNYDKSSIKISIAIYWLAMYFNAHDKYNENFAFFSLFAILTGSSFLL